MRRIAVIIAASTLALHSSADPPAKPAEADWKSAADAKVMSPLPDDCSAKQIGQWVRFRCSHDGPATVSVLSGDASHVHAWIVNPLWNSKVTIREGVVGVDFKVEKGTRLLMEVSRWNEWDYNINQMPWGAISVQWMDDQTEPWIVFTRAVEPAP